MKSTIRARPERAAIRTAARVAATRRDEVGEALIVVRCTVVLVTEDRTVLLSPRNIFLRAISTARPACLWRCATDSDAGCCRVAKSRSKTSMKVLSPHNGQTQPVGVVAAWQRPSLHAPVGHMEHSAPGL